MHGEAINWRFSMHLTYWSIAQKNNRETEAKGLGWELFKNYLVAKEKFKPDFFLYENNKSAAQAIKNQIKHELKVWDGTLRMENSGARYIEINSALVSAQNRQRFYVHNCGEVGQPEDRGILLKDILETTVAEPINATKDGKAIALKAQYQKDNVSNFVIHQDAYSYKSTGVAEPIRVGGKTGLYAVPCQNETGCVGNMYGKGQNGMLFSIYGKSKTLSSGQGVKGRGIGSSNAPKIIFPATVKTQPIYEVKDGQITIKDKQYPIKLADGYYIIRKLTVTECERLQTMPDGYTSKSGVSASQCYKGLGNGWTASVVEFILNHALKDIPKDEEIVVLSMYDGIGTGRYILDKMGFTNVKYYASEIDKYAMQIAKYNYPDIIECGDAFAINNPDWTIEGFAELNKK